MHDDRKTVQSIRPNQQVFSTFLSNIISFSSNSRSQACKMLMLHLISLNKYVVTLIINQGNSCLTYFMIVSLFLAVVLFLSASILRITKCNHIIPLLEKILLLVRYCGSGEKCENSMKKFVLSSIIRTICSGQKANSFSLFVLFHLFQ